MSWRDTNDYRRADEPDALETLFRTTLDLPTQNLTNCYQTAGILITRHGKMFIMLTALVNNTIVDQFRGLSVGIGIIPSEVHRDRARSRLTPSHQSILVFLSYCEAPDPATLQDGQQKACFHVFNTWYCITASYHNRILCLYSRILPVPCPLSV